MAERSVLPIVGLAVRVAAAAIWLVAGAVKVADLEQFHVQVRLYQLLPHALEAPFAYALPFVELLLGLYLLAGLLTRWAGILGSVLMLAFLIAQAQAWARGLSFDCGCFGALARTQVGAATIARDAALALPSLLMALRPARLLSLDSRLLGLPDRFGPRPRSPAVGWGSTAAESR